MSNSLVEEFLIKDKPNIYVRYAEDLYGTGFSDVPTSKSLYLGVLASEGRLDNLSPEDFAGRWARYVGQKGDKGDKSVITISPTTKCWVIDGVDTGVVAESYDVNTAKSYCVGGTGTRAGEDTDNTKYYKEQCDAIKTQTTTVKTEVEALKTQVDAAVVTIAGYKTSIEATYAQAVALQATLNQLIANAEAIEANIDTKSAQVTANAAAAASSASQSRTYATNAQASADAAAATAATVSTFVTRAETAATNAEASATNAQTAAAAAETSKTGTAAIKGEVEVLKTSVETTAATVSTKVAEASGYATAASQSATAASLSATTAASSATAAATSATAAETSKVASETAATNSQQYYNQLIEVYQPDTLGPCSNMGIVRNGAAIYLTWSDPANVVVANTTRAKYWKTECWRLQSPDHWPEYPGYPGAVLVGKTEAGTAHPRDAYSANPLIDNTAEEGVSYAYALFSYSTNGAITIYIANRYPIGASLSWGMIGILSRENALLNFMSIGDIVTYTHTDFTTPNGDHEIPVRLVSMNGVAATDRDLYPNCSVWETVDCLYRLDSPSFSTGQWDEAEAQYALTADATYQGGKNYYKRADNTYTKMVEGTDYTVGDLVPEATTYEKNPNTQYMYGTNINGQDNLGQWLNADALSGWVTKKNLWDTMSANYSSRAGFMYGLEASLKGVLAPAVRKTAKATTYGGGSLICTKKIFLSTLYEKYGALNNGIQEGASQWEYYVGTGNAAKIKMINNVASAYWMDSPISSNGSYVYYVTASGASSFNSAHYRYGVAPCFLVGSPDPSFNQQS